MVHHLSDHPKRSSKQLNKPLLNTHCMDSAKPGFHQYMVVELEIETFPSLVNITPKGSGNFIQQNRTLSGHRHVALHVQVKGLRKEGPIFGKSKWGFHQPKSRVIPAQGNMGMGPTMGWITWWRDEHTTAILVGNPGCQEFEMAIDLHIFGPCCHKTLHP